MCFRPQPRDAVRLPWRQEPTVLHWHLQPVPKPHSWRGPYLLSAHSCCELWCVALGPPSGGVFHGYPHIPAYPPETQADERGLKTHSGASQATQPMSNKVSLGSLGPCVERVGPGLERASSCKDLVWKLDGRQLKRPMEFPLGSVTFSIPALGIP